MKRQRDYRSATTDMKLLRRQRVLGLFAAMSLVLIACTVQVAPSADGRRAAPATRDVEVGIALVGRFDEYSQPIQRYPVNTVVTTKNLTTATIGTLSAAYSGVVRLEYALVYIGDVKWELFYTSEVLPTEEVGLWREYILLGMGSPLDNAPTDRSLHTQWWSAYAIAASKSLVGSTEPSMSSTLAQWVNELLQTSGAQPEAITKLLFSVEQAGKKEYVLYMSDLQADGNELPPDEENTCPSSREKSFYCTIVKVING